MSQTQTPPILDYAAVKTGPFVSPMLRGRIVQGLLGANILVSLAAMVSSYWQVQLLESVQAGTTITAAQVAANDSRVRAVALVSMLLILVTAILFLMWVHLTTRNLRALSGAPPKFSPGAAVGWFFCPFMNLIRVPQVLAEIWYGSTYPVPFVRPMPVLIGLWWGGWIFTGLLTRIAVGTTGPGASIPGLIGSSWMSIVAELLSIATAGLAIAVVLRINHLQENHPGPFSPGL